MLTSIAVLKSTPLIKRQSVDFLTILLASADKAIQSYLKRNIELRTITRFHSGNGQRQIILQEYPVTEIVNLWFDPSGYYGKASGTPFGTGTLLTHGTQYVLDIDSDDGVSKRGLVTRIGGSGAGFIGFYPENFYSGKLSSYRLPTWPRGEGNIKVEYTAGFAEVPADLAAACISLVGWLIRNMPLGGSLQSESLGAYSYSMAGAGLQGAPELGSIRQLLSTYRETQV